MMVVGIAKMWRCKLGHSPEGKVVGILGMGGIGSYQR